MPRSKTLATSLILAALLSIELISVADEQSTGTGGPVGMRRAWFDMKGRKIIARFVEVSGDKIVLDRDGKQVKVDYAKLSANDQRFVHKLLQDHGLPDTLPEVNADEPKVATAEPDRAITAKAEANEDQPDDDPLAKALDKAEASSGSTKRSTKFKPAASRTWTNLAGKKVWARMLKTKGSTVVLAFRNKPMDVEFQQLSADDQQYVRQFLEERGSIDQIAALDRPPQPVAAAQSPPPILAMPARPPQPATPMGGFVSAQQQLAEMREAERQRREQSDRQIAEMEARRQREADERNRQIAEQARRQSEERQRLAATSVVVTPSFNNHFPPSVQPRTAPVTSSSSRGTVSPVEAQATAIGALVFTLAFVFLILSGFWKTFEKAGEKGWLAIVPIANTFTLIRIAGMPAWFFLFLLIPVVGPILFLVISVGVARNFGRGLLFGLGLGVLPFIFYPILGYSDAEFEG